jgi:hypothetical protein
VEDPAFVSNAPEEAVHDGHLVLLKDPMRPHVPLGLKDELIADIERLRLPELEPPKGWRSRARRRAKH